MKRLYSSESVEETLLSSSSVDSNEDQLSQEVREGDLGVAERQLDVGVHGGNRVRVGTVNGVSLPLERELVSFLCWVGTISDGLCRK